MVREYSSLVTKGSIYVFELNREELSNGGTRKNASIVLDNVFFEF
jgi:hypothetical protein